MGLYRSDDLVGNSLGNGACAGLILSVGVGGFGKENRAVTIMRVRQKGENPKTKLAAAGGNEGSITG